MKKYAHKIENMPLQPPVLSGVGKCPAPGQHKICKCPTPGTEKAGKCPTVAGGGGGGWVQLELTNAQLLEIIKYTLCKNGQETYFVLQYYP